MADHLRSLGIRIVSKPFDIDHLLAEVQAALGAPEAQVAAPGEQDHEGLPR